MDIRDLPTTHYHYELPAERIADYPLAQRDASKLLLSDGLKHDTSFFSELPKILPENSFIVFNDTRVLYARLIFQKLSGAEIEVFLLEPQSPSRDIQLAFQEKSGVEWNCLVGNSRRWKDGVLMMSFEEGGRKGNLRAERIEKGEGHSRISFEWDPPGLSFAEVLEACGRVPLPPYIHREAEPEDKLRYQTVFARNQGSVAAPTAGLHFTENVMNDLQSKGHRLNWLTLHVGAGTFKPVSSDTIGGHEMHREQIIVKKDFIKQLAGNQDVCIAVGTTSVRSLESLYWIGVKVMEGMADTSFLGQWEPYELPGNYEVKSALKALLDHLEEKSLSELKATTQLIIAPGYKYRVVDAMLTNFHQPGSTLLMLVAAYLGEGWRQAYQYALDHDFRFLSYGDACLFIR